MNRIIEYAVGPAVLLMLVATFMAGYALSQRHCAEAGDHWHDCPARGP